MPIKDKNLRKCHSDKRLNIDVLHKLKISEYEKKNKEYEHSKVEILKLQDNIYEDEYIYHQNIIKTYEDNINDNEDNYYLDNGEILDQYYTDIYHITDNKKKDGNTILNWFSTNDNEIEPNTSENEDDIIVKYLSKVDDGYLNININDDIETMNLCIKCNDYSMIFKLNDSEMYCTKCGYTEDILIHTEKTSFKDIPKEISYFAYKRINHFNEWIAQIQAKETTAIPSKVYKEVITEINKNKLDITKITHRHIREILKHINCNRYYEHIPHIMNVITGNKKPIIFGEYEDRLRNMFKEIQIPFMNNCPNERKNFLSYAYVLHKFCELLELDHLLEFFPLLKSREKLKQQDMIWLNICKDLKWQYIPSI